jgi:hypothetical protein
MREILITSFPFYCQEFPLDKNFCFVMISQKILVGTSPKYGFRFSNQNGGREMLAGLKKTEMIFKICLVILFLFLMWVSRTYPRNSRLFPQILGGITVILIIVSFVQDFLKIRRSKEKKVVEESLPEAPPSDIVEEKMRWMKEVEEKAEDAGYEVLETGLRRKRLVESILIILISLGIGYLGGFLLIVPFYFIAFGLLHGQKKKAIKYIIIAVAITVVTYLSFTKLMGIPLLQGFLWELD